MSAFSQELESDDYDVIVLGTGLAESITAAALAKAGKTVLHLDENEYYGSDQASLTLDELIAYKHGASGSSQPSTLSGKLEEDRRRYSLSLYPAVVPSRGALIETLIDSDVSKYVSFRMLDSVYTWQEGEAGPSTLTPAVGNPSAVPGLQSENDTEPGPPDSRTTSSASGHVRRVPGSKEDVFKDKSVSLVDKRKLMRFLQFASGDFENSDLLKGKEEQPLLEFLQESFKLPSSLATSIACAIAHCSSPSDPTLPALFRTKRYISSAGRYGSGAFLVGQYGCAGEIAQGFCRACAVYGGTYVLGPSAKPTRMDLTTDRSGVTLEIPCHPRPVKGKHLIADPKRLPTSEQSHGGLETKLTAHCIAIVSSLPKIFQRPVSEEGQDADQDDTALLLFPADDDGSGNVVRALMMGEGTGACPSGQFLLYLSTDVTSTEVSPQAILKPYLNHIAREPPFESYRLTSTGHILSPIQSTNSEGSCFVPLSPYAGDQLTTESLDWAAIQAKEAYEKVMGTGEEVRGFFEKLEGEEKDDEEL